MNAARFTPGAISLSSSSHFVPMPYSYSIKPVAMPPGRARVSTKPAPTGSATLTNTIGTLRGARNSQDDIGRESNQFRRGAANALGAARAPADVNADVATFGPARLR